MSYSKHHKQYGYIVINSDSEVLDGIDENGKPHFTPQYMLEELQTNAMVFQDRYRLPGLITSKLDTSHGLLEVRLDTQGHADIQAILNGRVIGSVNTISAPSMPHSETSDVEHISLVRWHHQD